jgi:hypothetical protein
VCWGLVEGFRAKGVVWRGQGRVQGPGGWV